jgi:hypothetical protein
MRARAAALLLACLPAAAAGSELLPIPLDQLLAAQASGATATLTARGLEITVSGYAHFVLPRPAEELEIAVEADGPVLLTWAASPPGGRPRPYGPPWRYVRVPESARTFRLDLRIADGWSPRAQPILLFSGGGRVIVHTLRMRAPAAGDAARAAFDRANLWAPESIGHTTINLLTPPFWSATRGVWLADVVAGLALVAFVAVLAAGRIRQGRLRPGLAIAVAALVAVAAWDVHLLARFLPMVNVALEPDPEARIRENVYVAPEVGALAALARSTLRRDERVGVAVAPNDWFAWETLCFNLEPRRCALVTANASEHAGLSGVDHLRTAELDAIVSYRGGPLPDGFVPVASVSPHAVVARRR